jgi:hypothetical protein
MDARTEREIRASLANASRSERDAANLPDLTTMRWGDLDVLGWRDPKAPQRGYLVVPTESGLRGIVLRAPQSRVTRTAQCLLCQTVHQDNVALFVARRPRGNGSSVGTYMCDDLQCSKHLRAKPLDLEARSRHLVASALGFLTQVTG